MAELPAGTVTFLFTDVEGSSRLWEEQPDAMRGALARHDEILQRGVVEHQGHVVKTTGDGVHAVFATAHDALDAAVAIQRELGAQSFEGLGSLRVRMGVHTCEAEYRDGDYYGSEVNRAARLMSVAHGGQVAVSASTSSLVRDGSVELVDLGEHRLRDLTLSERVFQVYAPGLVREFPPLRSVDALPGNLPRQVTSFVGRENEVASLSELVLRSSLVTLTGVGGVGKTRLALEIAAEVIGEFPHGAWLCEFAPVTDPDAVWETVAGCLRVQPLPGRTLEESVLDYLAAKRLLLVLDNCEHLLDASARLVDAIEHRCPMVAVLATSREGLGLAGERMIAVPSLGVPAGDADGDELRRADAVCLFAERAGAAKRDFVLTDRTVGAVAVLCRRLDGIPLAIELAAARIRSLSPEDLVARLDQRFKFLTHGSRAALERHQTLRSTIDWSYDLLAPTERDALGRLSVFAGGCDLVAAETVLPADGLDVLDVIEVLGQLVDKSLVVADDTGAGVRYGLLETIRQYARERLDGNGDPVAVRRRHADHYVAVAEEAGPHLRSREHVEWADVIEREVDNFRAALDWAVETTSPAHALRLVAALAVHGRTGEVAMDWAATALAIPGGDRHPLYPVVAVWAAWGATLGGDFERAENLIASAEQAEAAFGPQLPSVAAARARLAYFRGDFEAARRYSADWVDLARASRDREELARALTLFGAALHVTEATLDPAMAAVEEAVRVARADGIDTALAIPLLMIANWLPHEDSDRALALLDEAVEVGTRIGDRMAISTATASKASRAAARGDWPTALRASVDAAEQKLELGDRATMYSCLYPGAVALCALGSYEAAAVLLGKADAMIKRQGAVDWQLELVGATDAAILETLGEQQTQTLTAQGAELGVTEAVAYLRAEADQALARPKRADRTPNKATS